MFKSLTFSLLLIAVLAGICSSQKLPKDKTGLAKVVQERYDNGDYDGAIKAGEKLIGLCRKTATQDTDSLINAREFVVNL